MLKNSYARQLFTDIPHRALSHSFPKNFTVDTVHAKKISPRDMLLSFHRSNAAGEELTKFNLCSGLNSCAKTLNFHLGLQLHARIIKIGFEENMYLSSALVDLYAKCGSIFDARKIFDDMENHDRVSWTSIISGYSQTSNRKEAILMFKQMLGSDIKPNCVTYVSVITSCADFKQVTSLHGHAIKLVHSFNSYLVSSLIDCYSKSGNPEHAVLLFHEASEKDNVMYNSMISGYSQNLLFEDALRLFSEMRRNNVSPTDHTLTSILNSYGNLAILQQGKQVHSLVIKMGSDNNVFVTSALIDMYSKCGSIVDSRSVFHHTTLRSSVLWTSMIMGYAQSGMASEALELFEHLVKEEEYKPDHICFMAVLIACNYAGLVNKGEEYFHEMRRNYGLVPDFRQYSCLIDLYARNGHVRKARELIDEMLYDPNVVMWSSFLGFCKVYGEIELGREAANILFKLDPHNAAAYVAIVHIYAKAGLWDEVEGIRKLMKQRGIRKSTGWSWVEVENKVHTFSVGDTSHEKWQEIYGVAENLNMEMKHSEYMARMLEKTKNV
ncbi:hypothetical protein ACFE04_002960 [Oxalis oulophora]